MGSKSGTGEATPDKAGKAGGGTRKLLLIIGPVLLLVVIAAVVYLLFLRPSGSDAEEKVQHVPGEVITLDAITINLAGGHFLKLGMALQSDANASGGGHGGGEITGAQALDAAIEQFSGLTVTELSTREGRDKAKKKLVENVAARYENQIYDIYFTEFVYQ